jgi:hypothetical protein
MAADDKDLDDFQFDDMDFDDFDMSFDPENDNRDPVTVVKDSAIESFKDTVTDVSKIQQSLEKALPTEYEAGFRAIDATKDMADDIKESGGKINKSLKKLARSKQETANKFLPEKIAKKLKEYGDSDAEYSFEDNNISQDEIRRGQMATALEGIFDKQQTIESKLNEEQQKVSEDQNELSAKKYLTELQAINAVRQGVERLVNYQDTILSPYQRKDLEIQYKQLYALTDILALDKRKAESDAESLAKIVKNTGLPETKKIQYMEEAERELAERSRQGIINTATGFFSDNIGSTIRGFVNNTTDKVTNALDSVSSGGGGMGDMIKEIGVGQLIGGMAGDAAGGGVLDSLSERVVDKIKEKDTDGELMRKGARLEFEAARANERFRDFTTGNQFENNPLGFLVRSLKESIPGFSRQERVSTEQYNDLNEPTPFTKQTERAIVHVIPGFLAKQLKELKTLVTGQESGEQAYDFTTGEFVTREERTNRLIEKTFGGDILRMRETVKDFVQLIDPKGMLGANQVKEFSSFMLNHLSKGGSVDIEKTPDLIDRSDMSDATKESVTQLIRDGFLISGDKVGHLEEDYNKATEFQKSIERLRGSIPNVTKRMDAVNNRGLSEVFRDRQWLDGKGNIQYDNIWQEALGGKDDRGVTDAPSSEGADEDVHSAGHLASDSTTLVNKDTVRTVRLEEGQYGRLTEGFGQIKEAIGLVSDGSDNLGDVIRESLSDSSMSPLHDTMINFAVDNIGGLEGIRDQLKELSAIMGHVPETHRPDWLPNVEDKFDTLESAIRECCIKEEAATQIELLKEIITLIPEQQIIQQAHASGDSALLDKVWQGATTYSKKAKSALMTYYGTVFDFFGKAKDGLMGMVDPAKEKLGGLKDRVMGYKDDIGDIYIKGKNYVALKKAALEAGEYIDEKTRKVIRSVKDITGPVIDKEGNYIITAEEYAAGLETKNGTSILKGAMNFVTGYYGMLGKGAMKGLEMGKTALNNLRNKFDVMPDVYVAGEPSPRMLSVLIKKGFYLSKSTGQPIYRLSDIDGEVVDRDGNVVLTVDDIGRGLVDASGEEIKGLIGNLKDKVLGAVKGAAAFTGKVYGGMFKGARDGFGYAKDKMSKEGKGAESFKNFFAEIQLGSNNKWDHQLYLLDDIRTIVSRGFGFGDPEPFKPTDGPSGTPKSPEVDETSSEETLGGKLSATIAEIKATLEEAFSKSQKAEEEDKIREEEQIETQKHMTEVLKEIDENTESETIRRGSWKDLLSRRTKKSEKGESEPSDSPSTEEEGERGSLLSSALGPLGGIVGTLSEKLGSLGDVITGVLGTLAGMKGGSMAADALGGAADASDLADGGGRNARRGGKLKRFGKAAWNFTKGTGKFLAMGGLAALKFAGTAVLPAVGTALASIGGAIGSVLSAPVVIGAAIVAGVTYGGYRLYKYINRYEPRDLDTLRFGQYGIDINNEEHRKKILQFEAFYKDNSEWKNGQPVLKKDVDYQKIYEIFDINKETPNAKLQSFIAWVKRRFQPVYAGHVISAKEHFKDQDMMKYDDQPIENKIAFLKSVMNTVPAGTYHYNDSPWIDESLAYGKTFVDTMYNELLKKFKDELEKKGTKKNTTVPTTVSEAVTNEVTDKPKKDTVPEKVINDKDIENIKARVKQENPGITTGELNTMVDMEATRVNNQLRRKAGATDIPPVVTSKQDEVEEKVKPRRVETKTEFDATVSPTDKSLVGETDEVRESYFERYRNQLEQRQQKAKHNKEVKDSQSLQMEMKSILTKQLEEAKISNKYLEQIMISTGRLEMDEVGKREGNDEEIRQIVNRPSQVNRMRSPIKTLDLNNGE